MSENAIRPKQAQALITHLMAVGRPVFLWGPPGIGKSDLLASISETSGRAVIDMRLLLMDPTDIKGIPYYNASTKSMQWAPSAELPQVVSEADLAEQRSKVKKMEKDAKSITDPLVLAEFQSQIDTAKNKLEVMEGHFQMQDAILFLDEMNSAPPSVQGAAYQLILNRRVGEYVLPDGVSIVAAGNRETDRGVTYQMPKPLANRFVHLEMEPNFEDWQKWAINSGVHPEVVGYLTVHKQNLFNFDPKSPDKAFATPRSWEFVSQTINDSMPESYMSTIVKGTVGSGIAGEFMAHRRVAAKMPTPEDVLTGKVTKLDVEDSSARYSLTIAMCYHLQETYKAAADTADKTMDDDKWHKLADYFFKFMMENFQPEMTVLGAKTALRDYKLKLQHKKLKNFKSFYEEYGKYILED